MRDSMAIRFRLLRIASICFILTMMIASLNVIASDLQVLGDLN
jgi:hypothetical protein